ncbi:PilW family protein [Ruminococcus albus]|uniref:Prepilin-type N-terminal cleavage/methylation domain-containing protein n=1 Tax=Ruminococcus albus TaxID=1264 RepID=A0A1I1JAV9_RUMAL|nr:prepilin-type N-terminal cleavage/methylation domain-containing protein [Ruminococcus albus]SFC45596.1 prepilin-type N-terminal cleavage/methylation domain-containing protein [Ruminococcus albus]
MKKNNKKGFTLIELVIVATIMVMIMGAILNWIRPMNKFYERTQALADSNDVGSEVMDFVDDELRYATNVVVLQDYQGVPKLAEGYLVDTSGNISYTNAKFTNALIIDNENIRGSVFPDYNPTSTVSRRKQARGCIIKANIDPAMGIDTDNMKCLGTEPIYNDYGCTFDATLKVLENKSTYVTIDMELTRPRREGMSYVFDKFGFKQARDFELVNVNVLGSDKMMTAALYSSRDGATNPLDYTKFAQASNTGSNGNAGALYGQRHTYILYTRDVTEAEKVNIIIRDEKDSNQKITIQKNSGQNLTQDEYNSLWDRGKMNEDTTWKLYPDGKYKKKKLNDILCNGGGGEKLEKYITTSIISDIDCYYEYTYVDRNEPEKYFIFYDRFNEEKEDKLVGGVYEFSRQAPYYPPNPEDGSDGVVSMGYDGNCDQAGSFKFIGWSIYEDANGPVPEDDPDAAIAAGWFVNGAVYNSFMGPFYAIYDEDTNVEFTVQGMGDLNIGENSTADDLRNNPRYQDMKDEAEDNAPENEIFSHFEVVDPEDSSKTLGNIETVIGDLDYSKAPFEIIPVYKPNTRPNAYEVTIRIDNDIPQYQWNALIVSKKTNNGIHMEITQEDGTTEVMEENLYYHAQKTDIVFAGTIFKLYVYDDGEQNIEVQVGNFPGISVSGPDTIAFDGSKMIRG